MTARRVPTLLLLSLGLLAVDLALRASPAAAGGRLIPRGAVAKSSGSKAAGREQRWSLQRARLSARVRASVATVRVDHVFRSESKDTLEADFVFPLPPGAKLAKLELRPTAPQQAGVRWEAGGVKPPRVSARPPMPGRVLRGLAARTAWLSDLERRRDPDLVRFVGTDALRVPLPAIAAGAEIALTLTYEQTLAADAGLGELACPLEAAAAFEAYVDLETRAPLGPIYSPTHPLQVARLSANRAAIRYRGTSSPDTPCLAVFWSTTRSRIGATLLTYWPKDEPRGYYLMLAEPQRAPRVRTVPRAKSITFVVDVSASMAGQKLEGMRAALLSTIEGLAARDHFNVIAYATQVSALWPEPRPSTPEARAQAQQFVRELSAAGHTNIGGALQTALAGRQPERVPSVMLFLTDGRPTVGEVDPDKILAGVNKRNTTAGTRIFVLGLGVDINTVMLDRLALDNGGLPSFVGPDESVEDRLRSLYGEIRHPILADVTFAAPGMHVTDTVAGRLPDLFEDGRLVFAGRYDVGGPVELILSGADGALEREYHYTRAAARRGEGVRSDFAARVWATRRIAALVDAIRLHKSLEPALVAEIVRLSTQFGILTEYTTFLAEENCPSCDTSGANALRARQNLELLAAKAMGGAGLAQAKSQVERRRAVRVPNHAGTWLATSDDRDVQRLALQSVRQAGNRTFYYRGAAAGWVDASVDDSHEPQATLVRWSKPFYELLMGTTDAENARLSLAGPLLLEVQGRILRIVDPS